MDLIQHLTLFIIIKELDSGVIISAFKQAPEIQFWDKFINVAERVGFEPTVPFDRYTHFPGEPVQPLLHLSVRGLQIY